MTIGERVAWYRHRRGRSQEVLAGMVGRTTDWLSKVENGRANLERLSVIKALADALDVTLGDLLGEPAILDWQPRTNARTVTLLRESLLTYPALTAALADADPLPADQLRRDVESVWDAYQASRFGYVTVQLPRVIATVRTSLREAADDASRREAQRLLALTYHAAAATLTKIGESDLAWIAADRGLTAAEASADEAVIASLLRSVAHALLSNGHYTAAADVVSRATDRLERRRADDDALHLSLLGSLHLVGAMAAARTDQGGEARRFLARARRAGQALGRDANLGWTAFGPTNVQVHDLSVAAELGEIQTAMALAPTVNVRSLPVERRVRHALEVAKVYTFANRADQAREVVLSAEREAPEQVRHHYIAREIVLTWLRQSRRPDGQLDALAQRLRLV
jgi:transcriptional regulator with XRE-family HTH domain